LRSNAANGPRTPLRGLANSFSTTANCSAFICSEGISGNRGLGIIFLLKITDELYT
jgi:hypothetical protein